VVPLGPTATEVANRATDDRDDLWSSCDALFPGLTTRRAPGVLPPPAAEAPADIVLAARGGRRRRVGHRQRRSTRLTWWSGRSGLPGRTSLLVGGGLGALAAVLAVTGLLTSGSPATSVAPSTARRPAPTHSSAVSHGSATRSSSLRPGRHQPDSSLPASAFAHVGQSSAVPAGPTPHPASAPSPPRAPGVFTEADATLVAATWEQRRAAALASGDQGGLADVETGAALQGDQAGAGRPPSPLQLGNVELTAAGAAPRSFVALFSAAGSPPSDALVFFDQPTDSSPWLATLVVAFPQSDVPGTPPSGSATTPVSSSTIDALAAAWQQWAAVGTTSPPAGSIFADQDAFATVGQAVVDQESVTTSRGMHEVVTFTAESGALGALPGGQAVCGAVLETAVFTGTSGAPLVQSADRSPWGSGLPPGSYPSVTQESVAQVCAVGQASSVAILGSLSGPFATTG